MKAQIRTPSKGISFPDAFFQSVFKSKLSPKLDQIQVYRAINKFGRMAVIKPRPSIPGLKRVQSEAKISLQQNSKLKGFLPRRISFNETLNSSDNMRIKRASKQNKNCRSAILNSLKQTQLLRKPSVPKIEKERGGQSILSQKKKEDRPIFTQKKQSLLNQIDPCSQLTCDSISDLTPARRTSKNIFQSPSISINSFRQTQSLCSSITQSIKKKFLVQNTPVRSKLQLEFREKYENFHSNLRVQQDSENRKFPLVQKIYRSRKTLHQTDYEDIIKSNRAFQECRKKQKLMKVKTFTLNEPQREKQVKLMIYKDSMVGELEPLSDPEKQGEDDDYDTDQEMVENEFHKLLKGLKRNMPRRVR